MARFPLPPGPPGSYAFATSTDGQTLSGHGSAAASLLPARRAARLSPVAGLAAV